MNVILIVRFVKSGERGGNLIPTILSLRAKASRDGKVLELLYSLT